MMDRKTGRVNDKNNRLLAIGAEINSGFRCVQFDAVLSINRVRHFAHYVCVKLLTRVV